MSHPNPKIVPTHDEVLALYRSDFRSFVRKAFCVLHPGKVFAENWHLDAIAFHLEGVGRGDISRLMINVPPRSLKSLMSSVFWPAFLIGNDPSKTVIVVSHSLDLSIDLQNKFRQLISSMDIHEIFPVFAQALKKDNERELNTADGGGRIAVSVDSNVTGRGADVIVIDDPLDASDADKENECARVNKWIDSTLSTRLNEPSKSPIVMVMQRLSTNDPSAHLATQEPWKVLSFPAIATKNESILIGSKTYHKREKGDLLDSDRFPESYLKKQKLKMGKRSFQAQFQQSPLPSGGGLIDPAEFKRYSNLPESYDAKFISVDPASGSDSGSYTAILGGRISNGRLYVSNVIRQRIDITEQFDTILGLEQKHKLDTVVVEKAGPGLSLLELLFKHYGGEDYMFRDLQFLQAITPRKSKVFRMEAAMSWVRQGRVLLPNDAAWLAAFESELESFPNGQYDDQVDALSQAIKFFDFFMTDPCLRICRGRSPLAA